MALVNVASSRAVDQLRVDSLRDQRVFVDTSYLYGQGIQINTAQDQAFLVGEVRAKLLRSGARLMNTREEANVVVEVRNAILGVDRFEYLLGIPAIRAPGADVESVPLLLPELAILKNLRQRGYSSVALVAFYTETGAILDESGPVVGETSREDYWFLGIGPQTSGDIPTIQN